MNAISQDMIAALSRSPAVQALLAEQAEQMDAESAAVRCDLIDKMAAATEDIPPLEDALIAQQEKLAVARVAFEKEEGATRTVEARLREAHQRWSGLSKKLRGLGEGTIEVAISRLGVIKREVGQRIKDAVWALRPRRPFPDAPYAIALHHEVAAPINDRLRALRSRLEQIEYSLAALADLRHARISQREIEEQVKHLLESAGISTDG